MSRPVATRFTIPLLSVAWLIGYWAPWLPAGSQTVWLSLALWTATHLALGLESSSHIVTIAIAFLASLGAGLRLAWSLSEQPRPTIRRAGLGCMAAPLSVVMPGTGAALYLTVLAAVVIWGCRTHIVGTESDARREPTFRRLLDQTFPVLSAACFLTMSWQYNAHWLLRGQLVAAGTALILRALLPPRPSVD